MIHGKWSERSDEVKSMNTIIFKGTQSFLDRELFLATTLSKNITTEAN